ncbi:prepilin-type N-terminal cleavage/methylation domain-containing protein [Vibrio aquaticus]|uniref:Prepilin-type N-terminal cleavage/methylation domain-containing protein n=1 Tax=Vibrio aquaticus TaxID=2496559 RepID=A0A3S0Q2V6_9VIBR|nr:prepilin-type N-terminal cleavage/methylation domain-containing protein [Vibrio aquaticus]
MSKNSGFTLIELVVVIVILGVLAVTAAPRFLNYQRDAHLSVADGAFASFEAGVTMYHDKWLTEGEPTGIVDYGEGDVYPSTTGFPISVNQPPLVPNNNDNIQIRGGDCVSLWNAMVDTDLAIRSQHSGSGAVLPSEEQIVSWYTSSNECYYYYYTPSFNISEPLPILYYSPLTGETRQAMEMASSS